MTSNGHSAAARAHEFMVFAEHFQFYVRDSNADPHLPVFWEDDDKLNMVMLGDRLVGVGTVRELDVPVSVEVLPEKPKREDLSEWDQVVEANIDIPSGTLIVEGPTEGYYEEQRIDVDPGTYGVRVYFGMLDEVDEDGFEGEDFYRVVLWKTEDPPPLAVLRQWQQQRFG